MRKYYEKNKTTHTKRASIYTENDDFSNKVDNDYLGVPSMVKGKSVPYKRNKVVEIPQQTRFSGAFNDFNSEWRKERQIRTRINPMRLNDYAGNGARGFHHHSKTKEKRHKFFRYKQPKLAPELKIKEAITQEQRTTEGAEIRGKEVFNHQQALMEIKQKMRKTNRGGFTGGKDGGAYTGGWRYIMYNDDTIRNDRTFARLNKQQDEFRSIVEGEQKMLGGNSTIPLAPE